MSCERGGGLLILINELKFYEIIYHNCTRDTRAPARGESILTDFRGVGRAGLPSTVIGLLFHAAKHTMRHVGQLMVTVAVVRKINIPI